MVQTLWGTEVFSDSVRNPVVSNLVDTPECFLAV
jgi:hypothetical protein